RWNMFLHYAFPIKCHHIDSSSCSSLSSIAIGSGGEQSRRSKSALATSLDPPSFVEGRVSSAIRRRTVLTDMPVIWAISAARRYWVPPVMTASPKGGEGAPGGRPVGAAEPSRGRLAVQEGERSRELMRPISEQRTYTHRRPQAFCGGCEAIDGCLDL